MWQQLVFPHIPKTAGWALHAALLPIFGEAHSLRINDGDDLARLHALSAADFAKYRYISGHFTFNDVKAKCSEDSLLVSILRDPVRRIVSEFNYVASWVEHPYHEHFKNTRLSQHVYANAAYLRGAQCDWLSGWRDAERAMTMIRSYYALVGTLEDHDAFIAALGRLIGRDVSVTRTNVTSGQGQLDFDSRLCGVLLDVTAEDRALMDRVASLPGGVFVGAMSGVRVA